LPLILEIQSVRGPFAGPLVGPVLGPAS
jgi:hypothetical protein